MRFFHAMRKHSFVFLNVTQFLGAMNDNVFKLIVVYLLINVKGPYEASTILATAGAVFVIPFIVFSSASGVMADRVSKRNILVASKALEVVLMSISIIAIYFKSAFWLYTLLFFMAFQSTVFGPSKYGIIPEIVDPKNVSKANGVLSAFTYLAIIIGTFFASFVTDITHKNFIIAGSTCIIIAVIGFLASLGIIKTLAKRSKKKINPLFFYEVYKTLVICSKKRYLISAVLGSSFFLFLGGFIQLNTIPFAIDSLNMSEVRGGYLFLAAAVGIAIGSFVAGKISRDKVEPGMACLSGFFLSFLLVLLGLFSEYLWAVIILLVMLGFFGGIFLIPFDSFIQITSPDHKRGRIIAASNFLSFVGVLAASALLYLINEVLEFTPAEGFIFMGILTIIFTVFITGRMSELFFSYISRKILLKIYRVKVSNIPTPSSYVVLINESWINVFLMFSFLPNLKVFTLGKIMKEFPFFRGFLNSLYLIKKRKSKLASLRRIYSKAKKHKRSINFVVLFLNKSFKENDIVNFLESHREQYPPPVFLNVKRRGRVINFNFTNSLDQNA